MGKEQWGGERSKEPKGRWPRAGQEEEKRFYKPTGNLRVFKNPESSTFVS